VVVQPSLDDVQFVHIVLRDDDGRPHPRPLSYGAIAMERGGEIW
jgi:hypothetical protein